MPPLTSPNTGLYTIGRGVLSIGEWSGTVAPASYSDVGNCPSFTLEPTEQVLEHFSSRTAAKLQDEEAITQSGYTLVFNLDETSVKNMQMFLKGSLGAANIIYANQNLTQRYAIKFVSDNAKGPNYKFEFWKVKLAPQGAFNLIGDEWSTMSFTGKGFSDIANHASSPMFTMTFATTTTTTTTTTTAP